MIFNNLKEKFSFLFKLIILIVCGIGLYLNFKIGSSKMLLYFTILSNLMCFIFYLIAFILRLCNKLKKNNFYYIFKGMVTMSIIATMLVYWFLIAPSGNLGIYENHMTECRFVHLYTPLLIMIDYLIFAEKGNLRKNYSFIWSSVLIGYIIFVFIYSSIGGKFINDLKYPYKFLDIEANGIIKTSLICASVYIIYMILGSLVYYFDKKIKKEGK